MFKRFVAIFFSFVSLLDYTNSSNLRNLQHVPQYNFSFDKFSGDWIQVKTSHYVQTTSEIDWFCTNINVSNTSSDTLKISISPKIHAVYYSPNKIVNSYNIINKNNNIIFNSSSSTSLLLRKTGPIVNGKYDYTILTGYDNVTFLVWARDFSRYNQYYDSEVMNLASSWEYNTSYKEPISVYSYFCLI